MGESLLRAISKRRPASRADPPLRPRQPVLLGGVPGGAGQTRLLVSMSGIGKCYDNAPMESFWGTLKQETGASPPLPDQKGGDSGYHRVYRDILQPHKDTGRAGFPVTGGLRPEVLCWAGGSMKVWCPFLPSHLNISEPLQTIEELSRVHEAIIYSQLQKALMAR